MGHFRQRIEILSLVFPAYAHMRLRSWTHHPNCMVPWPGEQMGQPRVTTCSYPNMTLSLPGLDMSAMGKPPTSKATLKRENY
jgi:hypothetical protein